MGRKKHPHGKAGTWIEVKVIKGRPYWYERTRVYLSAGKSRITSKYLRPSPERTPRRHTGRPLRLENRSFPILRVGLWRSGSLDRQI